MKAESVLSAMEKHRGERGAPISIMEDIQSQYGYLPQEAPAAAGELAHLFKFKPDDTASARRDLSRPAVSPEWRDRA